MLIWIRQRNLQLDRSEQLHFCIAEPQLVAGTYVLTVTGSNGCTSTAEAMVDQDDDILEQTQQAER
ncbi:MAG: hypothetical protein IPI00_14985 [Flavobacteriales bacterium]|nr:hypothetical protein [Flavobacteriales bacterium]